MADKWADAIDDWTAWMRTSGYRPGTIGLRRYYIRRLGEAHIRRSPWRITTDDLVRWMAGQDWTAGTRDTVRSSLRLFYGWAADHKRVRRDPADQLPRIRVPRRMPRPTPDDVWTVAMAAASDRDRLVLALGAYAGMRRSEIAAARWDWISAETIRVEGKGGHVRIVPLHPELKRLLDAERHYRKTRRYGSGYRYRPDDDGGHLFPGRGTGTHMTPQALGRAASRVLGGQWASHTNRHRFATRVLDATGNLAVVQDLLGHASPVTTRIYTPVSGAALRDAVHAI